MKKTESEERISPSKKEKMSKKGSEIGGMTKQDTLEEL